VSPAQRQQAVDYIDAALAERDDPDRAAVVVFGDNALVERAPEALAELGRLTSTPIASRTNIEAAIQLGLALFPADTQKRLVLLSDGRQNEGRATEAVSLAAVRDVPLDVVPLVSETGADVLVGALDAPETVREGQSVPLQATIRSSFATSGQLQVFLDNELVETLDVDVAAGTTQVDINVPAGESGFHRYEVRLEAEGDTQPINNRAAAFSRVQGPPRVLLIASEAERAEALRGALEAANARVEVRSPNQAPAEQAELRQYDAVMLVDVLARDVPQAVQQALPIYVREQGGSLAMIGGRESFGAGGWRRSPVTEALPVLLETPDTQQRPDVALVLVIDRSGSMSEPAGLGLTKLDLAKEAVYQSSLGLEQGDQIGVVGFDTLSEWVLDVQPLPSVADIELALSSFNAGGGTNIRSGIEPAADALAGVDARTKHVILLTDGLADSNYSDLIRQMEENGVTISVVSIGVDANPALRQIAELGSGRFYRVQSLSEVPDIFLSETIIVAGRDIVEGQFVPAIALRAPAVRGLGSLPPLYGYNATEPRQAARTLLVSPDGKPILAQWQYGLGRGVAWTSDLKGQWARDWTTWAEFPRFVSGLLDALLPPRQTEGLALETRQNGAETIFDLTVQDSTGRPQEASRIEARLLDPENQGTPLTFRQVGAGRYRAIAETDEPGVYLTQIAVLDEAGQAIGNLSSGVAVSYSPEYRPGQGPQQGADPLLGELSDTSAGRQSPPPAEAFAPTDQPVGVVQEVGLPLLWLALLLWPLDIASRRLLLRWGDLTFVRERLGRVWQRGDARPTPAPAESTVARLQTARSRARPARAAPERPQPAPERPQPAAPRQPAPEQKPPEKPPAEKRPAPAPRPAEQRAAAQSGEDAVASLLAAKQRARRQRQRAGGEGQDDEAS
jgi:Mg-chelatase subunit ChlD